MNPHGTPDARGAADSRSPLPPYPPLGDPSRAPPLSALLPSPALVPTGRSCLPAVSFAPFRLPSGPALVPSPGPPASALPGAGHGLALPPARSSSVPQRSPGQAPSPGPPSTPKPYSAHISVVVVPSPDPHRSPPENPDLECSICFSQFNNVFRCPKMLRCKHTFCLECLARINVKSAQPSSIQCPLCRGVTALPALGLPTLATDLSVLTYLPAAMQRVYSVRFSRSKGRLRVKRSSAGARGWRRGSDGSLDVGLPSPPAGDPGAASGLSEALLQLTGRPACRALLLTSLVLLMVLLMGIIVFLITFRPDDKSV